MWDFLSLFQKDANNNRLIFENIKFGEALGALGEWYAHRNTTVFQLTRFPTRYLEANKEDFENLRFPYRKYHDRGWPFFEGSVAGLIKEQVNLLDLGQGDGNDDRRGLLQSFERDERTRPLLKREIIRMCTTNQRNPPLIPKVFEEKLMSKVFTNGKEDKPLVTSLQSDSFKEKLGNSKELLFVRLGWGDIQGKELAGLFETGDLVQLKGFSLVENQIRDAGIKAIAPTLQYAPQLQWLRLSQNQINHTGAIALLGAIEEAKLRGEATSGLKWHNVGAIKPVEGRELRHDMLEAELAKRTESFGWNWEAVGTKKPAKGTELEVDEKLANKKEAAGTQKLANKKLADALVTKTNFTQEEWDELGVRDLRIWHFIKAGGTYFRPSADFTKEEWGALGIPDLHDDDLIKSGTSYFRPEANKRLENFDVLDLRENNIADPVKRRELKDLVVKMNKELKNSERKGQVKPLKMLL